MTESDKEWLEERSAIYEFDGEMLRETAERLAFQDLQFKKLKERAQDDKPTADT